MKQEDIEKEWSDDTQLVYDQLNISRNAVGVPKLHHKYYSFLLIEKKSLRYLEARHAQLVLEKRHFLVNGPSKETNEKGWVAPDIKVAKVELDYYMNADKEFIASNLAIGAQNAKVDFLKSIIQQITYNITPNLKVALEDIKFKHGS